MNVGAIGAGVGALGGGALGGFAGYRPKAKYDPKTRKSQKFTGQQRMRNAFKGAIYGATAGGMLGGSAAAASHASEAGRDWGKYQHNWNWNHSTGSGFRGATSSGPKTPNPFSGVHSAEEAQKVYRAKAREFHPDMHTDPAKKAVAEENFKDLQHHWAKTKSRLGIKKQAMVAFADELSKIMRR